MSRSRPIAFAGVRIMQARAHLGAAWERRCFRSLKLSRLPFSGFSPKGFSCVYQFSSQMNSTTFHSDPLLSTCFLNVEKVRHQNETRARSRAQYVLADQ